jgi:hypothetical protein
MYLPSDSVGGWVHSILNIRSVVFRAHFLVWLVSTHKLFSEKEFSFFEMEKAQFKIGWTSSFLLEKTDPAIPKCNIDEFLKRVREGLDASTLFRWLDEMGQDRGRSELLNTYRIGDYVFDVVLRN